MTDRDGLQWVGNGYGIYRILGMPLLKKEAIAVFLGFTEKDGIIVEEKTASHILDYKDGEPLGCFGPHLIYGGEEYETFIFGTGAYMVNTALIAPIFTKTDKDANINYQLEEFNGEPHIGVYLGFDKIAVLSITRATNELIERYTKLISLLKVSNSNYLENEEISGNDEETENESNPM